MEAEDHARGDGPSGLQIAVPRGLFTRRNRSVQTRKRPVDELLNSAEGDSDALTSFKVTVPPFPRGFSSSTTFPKNCPNCFPPGRKTVSEKYVSLGIRNWLNIKMPNKGDAPEQGSARNQPDPRLLNPLEVVEDPRFESLLQNQNKDAITSVEKKRALKFLEEFGVQPMTGFLRLLNWICGCGWLAAKFLRIIFEAVCVHDGQLELLKSYHNIHPIIYVPLQRSHWDHIVLSWVLSEANLKTPLVIARRSLLDDPLLGISVKQSDGLGCVNRRKKPDNPDNIDISPGQASINIALELYLKRHLKNATSLEISVESHRSRSGKPSTVCVGTEFIQMIASSVKCGGIEDAYIVPVNVVYEKLPEVVIIGKSGSQLEIAPSSFFGRKIGFLSRLWNLLFMNLGFVRINFGHPISIREFQSAVMTERRLTKLLDRSDEDKHFWISEGCCIPLGSNDLNWDNDTGSVTSLSSAYADTDTMVATERQSTLTADLLTSHVVYDAFVSTPVMSTDILAFLLLTRYRKLGTTIEKLVWDFEDLFFLFRAKKLEVGFSRKSDLAQVVQRAARLLGSDLVVRERGGRNQIILKPVLNRSSLVELAYYSNRILPSFALESIIAAVIFKLQDRSLKILNNVGSTTPVYVKENDVVEKSINLAVLLKAEFLLHPPCQQLEDAIKMTIDKMRDEYFITREVKRVCRDEDDEDWPAGGEYVYSSERLEIRSIEDPVVYESLVNVKNLIIPYIQAYAEAFQVLSELLPTASILENDMADLELRQKMLDRLISSPAILPEVAIPDTISNLIASLKSMGILSFYSHESTGIIMLMLTEEFSDPLKLEVARNNMLSFCTF